MVREDLCYEVTLDPNLKMGRNPSDRQEEESSRKTEEQVQRPLKQEQTWTMHGPNRDCPGWCTVGGAHRTSPVGEEARAGLNHTGLQAPC